MWRIMSRETCKAVERQQEEKLCGTNWTITRISQLSSAPLADIHTATKAKVSKWERSLSSNSLEPCWRQTGTGASEKEQLPHPYQTLTTVPTGVQRKETDLMLELRKVNSAGEEKVLRFQKWEKSCTPHHAAASATCSFPRWQQLAGWGEASAGTQDDSAGLPHGCQGLSHVSRHWGPFRVRSSANPHVPTLRRSLGLPRRAKWPSPLL